MSPLPPDQILANTAHRPWEIPKHPWVMAQSWQNLLFAHWAYPAEKVHPLIPKPLRLDTWDGMAYIGVVPFLMNHVRGRSLPEVPTTNRFLELNVRTYVTYQDKPGVWFFSLDASNLLAVRFARLAFHLPYFDADMAMTYHRNRWIQYDSRRTHRGVRSADFIARYRPTSDVYHSQAGSLEEWLTERYCLYAVDKENNIYRGEIHHDMWNLQSAEAEIVVNTMGHATQLALPITAPILHYVENIDVLAWYLEKC